MLWLLSFPRKSSTINKQRTCLSLTQRESPQKKESPSSLPQSSAQILARRVVLRKRAESVLCSTAINSSVLSRTTGLLSQWTLGGQRHRYETGCDLINSVLTQWRLTPVRYYCRWTPPSSRKTRWPGSKHHQIQLECGEWMSCPTREETAEPVSRDQILRSERGHGKMIWSIHCWKCKLCIVSYHTTMTLPIDYYSCVHTARPPIQRIS